MMYILIRILTALFPMRVTLDGTDNTITINKPLFHALKHIGIETTNNIYLFAVSPAHYAFSLLDNEAAKKTITRQLLYNTEYKTFGFEAACPTIQLMLNEWQLPHNSVLYNVSCHIHRSKAGIIYFTIDR